MRIDNVTIRNLRAIRFLHLERLERMVLIAGPNGSGKSCIFDALRLLKSCYGGYQPNEWQQWFGEFSINISPEHQDLRYLFRDLSLPIVVSACFILSETERRYLAEQLPSICEQFAWQQVAAQSPGPGARPIAQEIREHGPVVNDRTQQLLELARTELANVAHNGKVEISSNSRIDVAPNALLEILFGTYNPKHIGIIDYHGAHRMYGREILGGINLNLDSEEQQRRQHLLYNTPNKYTNIKSAMASTFVRDLIARERGLAFSDNQSMIDTLRDLFALFFPDKTFDGPIATADGAIEFPVKMADGVVHDINDLSSGEKEVLFGYLRLRNSSPRNSVVLLDEPEMHLNPALIKGLPQFYKKHIGEALNTQLWLVTHSDDFLREAAGQNGFTVFHMQHASQMSLDAGANQALRIEANEELERAIVDLIGDLATYQPGARVVIFEGDSSDFDIRMTSRLFPELSTTEPDPPQARGECRGRRSARGALGGRAGSAAAKGRGPSR